MVPHDGFTPYGYLDNPYHSWKINPSGVLRSLAPLGMGWHMPNFGSYVRNQFQYTAHLTIGLKVGNMVLITAEDFRQYDCAITSHLHTKNRLEYTCTVPRYGLMLTARYFLVQEHALGCMLSLSTTTQQFLPVTCYLIHLHTHNPYTSRLWEHGLYTCEGSEKGCVTLGLASEGDVFVHGARPADRMGLTFDKMGYVVSLDDASAWARGEGVARPSTVHRQEGTGWQVRTVILPCTLTLGSEMGKAAESTLNVVLARGVSQDQAYAHWVDGIERMAQAEADHSVDDEKFWGHAPQLSGDWPATWRRGLIYDLETLRMIIRPPIGMLSHPWDGMQIQAPRTVLAETAMDVLCLSYADPALAAEVILGHFESSPHPQLPCMREDGSYSMVADDGQLCGTAPERGFPIWCCDLLFRRTGDMRWLRRLYPRAAAYLRWWLEHRRDAEGWLVYACSWESGQDVSSRFGPQQTGGTIIQHIRPVALQASMVQGAEILARWAMLLAQENITDSPTDFYSDATSWRDVASEFTVKTQRMWQNGWFRDYDSVTKEWSTQQDAMHLAPVFCGASSGRHVMQLQSWLSQSPFHNQGWAPLCWPPVVMTLVGAAGAAQMSQDAAELAYRYIDASYRSTDSGEADEEGGLPGVTREYRRLVVTGQPGIFDYANAGIEGYGWGALSIHLLMRYILGLREEEADMMSVAPMLPHALRRVGATYSVAPVQWGEYVLSIECVVRHEEGYAVRIGCSTGGNIEATVWEWEGRWGEVRRLQLPQLIKSSVR